VAHTYQTVAELVLECLTIYSLVRSAVFYGCDEQLIEGSRLMQRGTYSRIKIAIVDVPELVRLLMRFVA
jgi:hypothetical protein